MEKNPDALEAWLANRRDTLVEIWCFDGRIMMASREALAREQCDVDPEKCETAQQASEAKYKVSPILFYIADMTRICENPSISMPFNIYGKHSPPPV